MKSKKCKLKKYSKILKENFGNDLTKKEIDYINKVGETLSKISKFNNFIQNVKIEKIN